MTEGVQSGNHNKDMNEQMKMQTELLESLREKQEVLRPSLLRLAAVERRQVLAFSSLLYDRTDLVQSYCPEHPHKLATTVC